MSLSPVIASPCGSPVPILHEEAKNLFKQTFFASLKTLQVRHSENLEIFVTKQFGNKAKTFTYSVSNSWTSPIRIIGPSIHNEYLRQMSFRSAQTFISYLQSVDEKSALTAEQQDVADYVENLFCEELGSFARDLSDEEAKIFLTDKISLLVRPNFSRQDCILVAKRFASSDIRQYCYLVHRTNDANSESGLQISGPAILQYSEKPVCFNSAVSFANYLHTIQNRQAMSPEAEQLASIVDQILITYSNNRSATAKKIIASVPGNPAQIALKRPYKGTFTVSVWKTSYKIVGPAYRGAVRDTVTFHSVKAFLAFINIIKKAQIKTVSLS